jgi:hypothetical protein
MEALFMRWNRITQFFFTFLFSFLLIVNCAGTKNDTSDQAREETSQQQDLDDIESLLGITSDQTPREKAPQTQNHSKTSRTAKNEKLDLLETSERPTQASNSMASAAVSQQNQNANEAAKYKKEVQSLKNKLKQKERQIQNLEQQISDQNAQIEALASQPKPASFAAAPGIVSGEEYKMKYEDLVKDGNPLFLYSSVIKSQIICISFKESFLPSKEDIIFSITSASTRLASLIL